MAKVNEAYELTSVEEGHHRRKGPGGRHHGGMAPGDGGDSETETD